MCLPSSYVCPHCGAKTASEIHPVIEGEFGPFDVKSYVEFRPTYDLKPVKLEDVASCYKEDFLCVTKCLGCARPVLWIKNEIVWPTPKGILPVEEMPQDAKEIFKEAQSIINLSPRAACALLRISLELLVNYAGRLESPEGFKEKARLIDRIESLGASAHIKELLHVCRVIGNEYAHPGVINMEGSDNLEMAQILSRLINQLVEIWVKPYLDAQRAKELLSQKS
jgi:hypothetical protein